MGHPTVKGFADLNDVPEDDRIAIIADAAASGVVVGFVVENYAKADRYIAKITQRDQRVRVLSRGPGPIPDSVLVRVGSWMEAATIGRPDQ